MIRCPRRFHRLLAGLPTIGALALGILFHPAAADAPGGGDVEIWHTFAAASTEEDIFLEAIAGFRAAHPAIRVTVTRIPYLQHLQQFINASQGGEAPDMVRVSDSELGRIGRISMNGLPLLEDLRPHLTPMERGRIEPRALAAMRYGQPLYALPASQGCMALLYNKTLFDAAGIPYPDDGWTTTDLLAAARALSRQGRMGMTLPLRWSYWFLPFAGGFGAAPLDAVGNPTLNAPGAAAAMNWFLDLERRHGVVARGTDLEGMSKQFMQSQAAMVLDGSWNWHSYVEAGVDLGLAVMPVVAETGLRMRPLYSYFGWAVAKQSDAKVAAARLALWLASADVQREFALRTYTLPTDIRLATDPQIAADPVLAGFLKQVRYGLAMPTTRATVMMFDQLDTALQMVQTGELDAQAALTAANLELMKRLRR